MPDVIGLLDTSVLIAMPEPMSSSITRFVSSSICRAELEYGVRLRIARGSPEQAAIARSLLDAYDEARIWLPFGVPESQAYGRLAATVATSSPSYARSKDALIAAHAQALGLPLVTLDQRFAAFEIPILTPDEAAAPPF